jgi:hypothetical protein
VRGHPYSSAEDFHLYGIQQYKQSGLPWHPGRQTGGAHTARHERTVTNSDPTTLGVVKGTRLTCLALRSAADTHTHTNTHTEHTHTEHTHAAAAPPAAAHVHEPYEAARRARTSVPPTHYKRVLPAGARAGDKRPGPLRATSIGRGARTPNSVQGSSQADSCRSAKKSRCTHSHQTHSNSKPSAGHT